MSAYHQDFPLGSRSRGGGTGPSLLLGNSLYPMAFDAELGRKGDPFQGTSSASSNIHSTHRPQHYHIERRQTQPRSLDSPQHSYGLHDRLSPRRGVGVLQNSGRSYARSTRGSSRTHVSFRGLDDSNVHRDTSQDRHVAKQTNNNRQPNTESAYSILEALEQLEDSADDDLEDDTWTLETSSTNPVPPHYSSHNHHYGNRTFDSNHQYDQTQLPWSVCAHARSPPCLDGNGNGVGVGEVLDNDMLLAVILQKEEDEYAAALRADRDRREEDRRQVVMQLLEQLPDAPPTPAPVEEEQTIHYDAPKTIDFVEDSNFTLANDCSWATENDICAICHDTLADGLVVSLRKCNHMFHLDCIDDALEHSKRCPKCRKDIRSRLSGDGPSGIMTVTRPVISQVPTSRRLMEKRVIQIEYMIPDGEQRVYHDSPGESYKGTIKIAYLPSNSQGNYILKRLIYAFSNGLTFRVARADSTEKSMINWASIPHRFSLGEKEFDAIYMASCNEALDHLGVPTSFHD